MSATMGYAVVAEVSHELETLLDLVRRGERAVSAPLMDTLFAATDMLERAIELSVAGRESDVDASVTIAALRAAAATEPTVHSPAPTATAKPRKKRSSSR